MTFANRCFLYEEDEETIDHLLIHCKVLKCYGIFFCQLLGLAGFSRIRSFTPFKLGKEPPWVKNVKKIWIAAPLCLFWTLWRTRNRLVFKNEVTFAQRIKANFVSNLWTWANLYCVDNTNSVLDFFTWLGSR